MGLIDQIYTKRVFYGSRRIRKELIRKYGIKINRKHVQRLMRTMGIAGVTPRRNTSRSNPEHFKYPYLLKGLDICKVNQVWGTDITYIRLKQGWMYLTVLMDWYSRFIVDFEISITLDADFCIAMTQRALSKQVPEILNSDQGSQFTSEGFRQTVIHSGALMSMDGRGRAFDNIFTERFWRSLKYEDIYLKDYESVAEAKTGIKEYINFYNTDRPHQSLMDKTPADVYYQDNLN